MISLDKLQTAVDNYQYNIGDSLLEATFYGKSKELLAIEAMFNDLVVLGHQNDILSYKFTSKLTDAGNRLGKLFGFSSFQINNSSIFSMCPPVLLRWADTHAGTMPHGNIIKYTKYAIGGKNGGTTELIDFDKNHKGIRFKPGSKYTMRMFINTSLFLDSGEYSLTGGEILACVLHEIGHNFYYGPVRDFGSDLLMLSNEKTLEDIVVTLCALTFTADGLDVVDKWLDSCVGNGPSKVFKVIYNLTSAIRLPYEHVKTVLDICKDLFELVQVIGDAIASLFTAVPDIIKAALDYDSEKYSDAFATSYGYGPELSSALYKIDHCTFPFVSKTKAQDVLNILTGIYKLPLSFIDVLTDPHPDVNQRLRNDIQYMEAAGADIKDPKLKKEYNEALQNMYAMRQNTKDYVGPDVINIKNKLHSCAQDLLKLSDPKEFVTGLRPTLNKYANLDYTM